MMRLFFTMLMACLLFAGCTESESQQAYPAKPITLVVPFGAGGGTDNYARIFKKAIDDEQLLPQPLVIKNIEGAGATIGSRYVKNAQPDGYTMLLLHDAILTAQASGKVSYGPEAFEPVAGTGEDGMVIAVWEDSPYEDLNDLLAEAQQRPGEIKFGANLGALTHYAGLQLEQERAGARFRYAQIGGGAKRFSDLKGGHIDVTGFSVEEFTRFRPDGVRGLAYFGEQRHAAADDVPTAREQGFNIATTNTFYWWVPKGTPRERIDVLVEALDAARRTEFVERKMAELQCASFLIRDEELQARLADSKAQYDRVSTREMYRLPDIPRIILVVTTGLLVVVLGQAWIQRRRKTITSKTAYEVRDQWRMLAGCAAITVVYVLAMNLQWLSYLPATIAFIAATGIVLTRGQRSLVPVALGLAVFTGVAIYLLFTYQFEVGLP